MYHNIDKSKTEEGHNENTKECGPMAHINHMRHFGTDGIM